MNRLPQPTRGKRHEIIADLHRDFLFISTLTRIYQQDGGTVPSEVIRLNGRVRGAMVRFGLTDAERRAVTSAWGN